MGWHFVKRLCIPIEAVTCLIFLIEQLNLKDRFRSRFYLKIVPSRSRLVVAFEQDQKLPQIYSSYAILDKILNKSINHEIHKFARFSEPFLRFIDNFNCFIRLLIVDLLDARMEYSCIDLSQIGQYVLIIPLSQFPQFLLRQIWSSPSQVA